MALAMPVLAVFMSLVMLSAMLLRITCLLMRYIDIVVPSVFYKIDGAAAGIVFAAVLAPVLLMTGRHVHVKGLINDTDRYGMNHDRSCVNEFGLGKTPYVNAAVKAGLGDTDRHPDIGGVCGCGGNKDDHDGTQEMFHDCLPLILMFISLDGPEETASHSLIFNNNNAPTEIALTSAAVV
jgi:hypothetical protein